MNRTADLVYSHTAAHYGSINCYIQLLLSYLFLGRLEWVSNIPRHSRNFEDFTHTYVGVVCYFPTSSSIPSSEKVIFQDF